MNETNEPKERASSPDGGASPAVRLAVFQVIGEEKNHLSTITLSKMEDGKWNLQAGGPSDASVEQIRPLLERFAESRQVLAANDAKPPESSAPDALTDMLTAEGFVVEKLPDGDHQINFQIDLKTGKAVGTHAAMHPLAASDDGLGRRVFDAITTGLGKFADELADEIDDQIAKGNVDGALVAIKREAERGLFSLEPSERLLESLMRFDLLGLPASDESIVRECRLLTAHRLQRFDVAGLEADAILAEDVGVLDPEQKANLRMTSALGSLRRGHRETALTIWRGLLKEPTDLTAEGRGWALRNISNSLPADDPEARRAAQASSDAFLEAGEKAEAGKSLMRLANILLGYEPAEAIKTLNEMIAVLDKEGLTDLHIRGAALHARANRFAKLHMHAEALRDATEATELLRGLLGAEAQFVSSLHLAAIEARFVGASDKADAFEAEATKLTDELQIPHFQLAERVSALVNAFDPKVAQELLQDAENAGSLEVLAGVRVIQATMDASLTGSQRLEMLEETHARLMTAQARNPLSHPVSGAIGQQLMAMGEYQRAAEWFRKIVSDDPLDMQASGQLVNCLWKMERWSEAATFIKGQLDLVGDKPGVLFAYGKSLFESGDFSGAIRPLTKALNLAGDNENVRNNANELRERALGLGGTILPPEAPKPSIGAVTRKEFETALDGFARFVAAEKRMGFWNKPSDGDYEWISRPEKRAQDLLHTALKARFEDRIEIFEEIGTGAGRLDLYVKLNGGLSIIVELKMCGFGYSSSYAAAGEEQINHYMDNRKTNLGYLVVFDARIDKFGQPLLSELAGRHTVIEKLIDVTPRVRRS